MRATRETKIFDPHDVSTAGYGCELADPTVAKRDDVWWMALAGQPAGRGSTDLFSARLEPHERLSCASWQPVRNSLGELEPLSGRDRSVKWDGKGGRHCPSYVKGFDSKKGMSIERIYYAGGAENLWGPYTIGFLEWDGESWQDHSEPAFVPNQDWEHGSDFEPNVVFHDAKWKMWYVAGSNYEDYLVHGYSESTDGRTDWSEHTVFAPPEMKMFDFSVCSRGDRFEAIFSRVWMGRGEMPAETGLWSCHSDRPSGLLADWSEPIQIMTAEDRGWHAGPWKPSLQFNDPRDDHAFVFFDGSYRTDEPGPFPFVFTLGCAEVDLSH